MRRRGRVGLPDAGDDMPAGAEGTAAVAACCGVLRFVAVRFWRIADVGITASAFDWDGA